VEGGEKGEKARGATTGTIETSTLPRVQSHSYLQRNERKQERGRKASDELTYPVTLKENDQKRGHT